MKIGITGAGGFVGKRFIEYNRNKYHFNRIPLRNLPSSEMVLPGVDVILHMAGKAHDMRVSDEQVYNEVNVDLTTKLANQAKQRGISHFIYISSVKVYGDNRTDYLDEDSGCKPTDAYGKSKLEAENYLRSIQSPEFKIAIVRPPLVYGPGVKGNMIRFLKLAEKNVPLPFGGVQNERSMVFIDNLVELINKIIDMEATGIFVAGDAEPISTTELMTFIRSSMNKRRGLVSIPAMGQKLLKALTPKLFNRLFGSFVIHNQKTNERLRFHPPYSTEYGVKQMVEWYLDPQKEGNLTAVIK